MRYAHEKRWLLGWLALLAPLPLPLNEPRPEGVVGWPFLLLWILVIGLFLQRVKRRQESWLGVRALNLLGFAYLPLLAVDLMTSAENLLIRPMMHLAMFALAAKLFSLERERDKWHALLGIFFVFVTSVATSTSVGIVVYLVVFLMAGAWVLARFSSLHMESFGTAEATAGATAEAPKRVPVSRRLLLTSLVLTVPVFLLLPRFQDPFLFGQGGGSSIAGTGFSDQVRLDGIGRIRTSSEVAFRLIYSTPEPSRAEMANVRFRGATYDRYQGDGWEQTEGKLRLETKDDGALHVGVDPGSSGAAVTSAELWLERLDARAVIVPSQTLRIWNSSRIPVEFNRAGALSFLVAPYGPVRYRVELGGGPRQWSSAPEGQADPTLDQTGISLRIAELADRVAEGGTPLQVAARIERHLQTEYEYQLELLGAGDGGAIDRFLFERKSGHCEYFASAMVLMLRSQGIASRFVTGFLGAEVSPVGYSIVRQSNAHAWVEAYLPGSGWMEFDPTPPAGRPTAGSESLLSLVRQTYDWMLFSWDRYVVGFSSGEQRRLAATMVAWFKSLFRGGAAGDETSFAAAVVNLGEGVEQPQSRPFGHRSWIAMGFGGGVLMAVLFMMWWRRRRFSALSGYLAVRSAASKAGLDVAAGPLAFARQVGRRFPGAREPVHNAVVLYLEHSFGQRKLDGEGLAQLKQDSQAARRAIREAARIARTARKVS